MLKPQPDLVLGGEAFENERYVADDKFGEFDGDASLLGRLSNKKSSASFLPVKTAPLMQIEDSSVGNESKGSFWRSSPGLESGRSIPKSAPPLKFRPVVWNSSKSGQEDENQLTSARDRMGEDEGDDGYAMGNSTTSPKDLPVGSALRVARQGK